MFVGHKRIYNRHIKDKRHTSTADEDDKKMMVTMAEFVCRANYGLKNGNFELDMNDGEIRVKCFVECEGITPTRDIVYNSIHFPTAMFKKYGAGIVDIIFGNSTAEEVIESCEKFTEEEIRSLLDELSESEDSELGEMLARLAERLGMPEESSTGEPNDGPLELITDLFGTEGENA